MQYSIVAQNLTRQPRQVWIKKRSTLGEIKPITGPVPLAGEASTVWEINLFDPMWYPCVSADDPDVRFEYAGQERMGNPSEQIELRLYSEWAPTTVALLQPHFPLMDRLYLLRYLSRSLAWNDENEPMVLDVKRACLEANYAPHTVSEGDTARIGNETYMAVIGGWELVSLESAVVE